MKVAIINPFGSSSGHSLNYSTKLCYNLAKQDVDLYLFTSKDYNPSIILGEKKLNYKIICTEVKNNTAFNKNYKEIASLLKYGINLIRGNFKVLKHVRKINREEKLDIIHIIGGETLVSILFFFLYPKQESQLILTIHNSDFEKDLYKKVSLLKEFYKRIIKFMLEKFFFYRFSKIMVHGEQMKRDLVHQVKIKDQSKIFPINIGLDANNHFDSRDYQKTSDVPRILFFGVIRKDKGLDILLEAIKKLSHDNFELLICGKPAEYSIQEIETLIDSTGKSQSITQILRYFDDEEIDGVFNGCDYVILPYMKTFKAQSVVLTLAAAYKRTLICSDTGQNGFDVKKYNLGHTFAAEDIDDLTKLLQSVIDKKILPIKETAIFDEYINDNSWENMGRKIFNMYLQ